MNLRLKLFQVGFTSFLMTAIGHQANAVSLWGSGFQAGNPACVYPQQVARGSAEDDDVVVDLREKKRRIDERLNRRNRDAENKKREVQAALRKIQRSALTAGAARTVIEHIQQRRHREDYGPNGGCPSPAVAAYFSESERMIAAVNQGGDEVPPLPQLRRFVQPTFYDIFPSRWSSSSRAPASNIPAPPGAGGGGGGGGQVAWRSVPKNIFCWPHRDAENRPNGIYSSWWSEYVEDEGVVSTTICQSENQLIRRQNANFDRIADCVEGIQDLRELEEELAELMEGPGGVNELREESRGLERQISRTIRFLEDTEADCEDGSCFARSRGSRVSDLGLLAGLGLTAGIAGLTFVNERRAQDRNNRMGWPTPPGAYFAMGFPLAMAGLQTFLHGPGHFGCAPGFIDPAMVAFGYAPGITGSGASGVNGFFPINGLNASAFAGLTGQGLWPPFAGGGNIGAIGGIPGVGGNIGGGFVIDPRTGMMIDPRLGAGAGVIGGVPGAGGGVFIGGPGGGAGGGVGGIIQPQVCPPLCGPGGNSTGFPSVFNPGGINPADLEAQIARSRQQMELQLLDLQFQQQMANLARQRAEMIGSAGWTGGNGLWGTGSMWADGGTNTWLTGNRPGVGLGVGGNIGLRGGVDPITGNFGLGVGADMGLRGVPGDAPFSRGAPVNPRNR